MVLISGGELHINHWNLALVALKMCVANGPLYGTSGVKIEHSQLSSASHSESRVKQNVQKFEFRKLWWAILRTFGVGKASDEETQTAQLLLQVAQREYRNTHRCEYSVADGYATNRLCVKSGSVGAVLTQGAPVLT